MNVRSSTSANRRIYIRFDLTKCIPAVPGSATIRVSTLRLFVTTIPTACRTQDIFKVTASWTQAGITWNNQPFGTSINNPPTAQRTASMTVGTAPCTNTTANAYVTGWNVTADLQAFVAGTSTNFGWMLRDDVENSATARDSVYSTRETNVLAQAPQLVITYSV
jgi:hypothetical protein